LKKVLVIFTLVFAAGFVTVAILFYLQSIRLKDADAAIASANATITSANATITKDKSYINALRYPSHFKTLEALKSWLAADDVDTKYATIPVADRAYILEIRATQDGYLLPVFYEQDKTDATKIYFLNMANIAGKIYVVNSANDSVTLAIALKDPPALRPLVPVTTTAQP
jgi:hypothetical protein